MSPLEVEVQVEIMNKRTAGASPACISDRLQARTAVLQIASPRAGGSSYGVPHLELLPGPPAHLGLVLSRSSLDPFESGTGTASPDCLDAFIRLALVPELDFPDRVLQFARKWGPLYTCKHGMPSWHSGRPGCTERGSLPGDEHLVGPDGVGWLWEPLEPWRRYSRQLLAIERLAVDLQVARPGTPADWKDVEAGNAPWLTARQLHERYGANWESEDAITSPEFYAPGPDQTAVDIQKIVLEKAIEVWFHYGNIRPSAIWWPDEPALEVRIVGTGLVGALAIQLAANLSDRVYICAGCTYPFRVPDDTRQPAFNKQKWCAQCGRHAQWKNYQRRRYHARKTKLVA